MWKICDLKVDLFSNPSGFNWVEVFWDLLCPGTLADEVEKPFFFTFVTSINCVAAGRSDGLVAV